MENNIVTWDFMGWKETFTPDVGVQLNWNKSLLEKFTSISSQINRNSLRGGADTITMYPALEGLLHPDYYDNHRKMLMGNIKIVLDETMDKYFIKLENLGVIEDLKTIPDTSVTGEVSFKPLNECTEEQIITYIEGLIGFVIIENLTVN
jgi:hypothetical protein